MSIRRINSTGRKKILREDAQIFVSPDSNGALVFCATLNLADYELPPEAQVFIEAYRQTTFMRFEHGTVASPQTATGQSLNLTEFSTRDGLLFRIKVTSTGQRPGILLAEGDRIPIRDDEEQPDNRIPLLPPAPADLGQQPWRIDFDGTGGPLLLVNNRFDDWKAVASSPGFRSLVYPAAMRQVLWHVVLIQETRHSDDPEDWRCRWLRFAASLPSVGELPSVDNENFDAEEWVEWIDSAVESFSRQHQMSAQYKKVLDVEAKA